MTSPSLALSPFTKISGIALFTVAPAFADLILYEGFEYDVATPIVAAGDSLQGWDGPWESAASAADGQGRLGLFTTVPGLSFESQVVSGGASQREARFGNEAISRPISSDSQTALTADGSTIWFSVIMQATGSPAADLGAIAGFATNTWGTLVFGDAALSGGSGNSPAPIGAAGNAIGLGFHGGNGGSFTDVQFQGITYSGGTATTSDPDLITAGDTPTLIVGSVTWAASGSDDILSLYHITDSTAPLPAAFATMTADLDQSTFNVISIGDAQTSIFDEIRFGENLVDVVTLTEEVESTFSISQTGDTLNFSWTSRAGMTYDLLSETDLNTPPSEWAVYNDGATTFEDIPASGTGNTSLTGVLRPDPKRFFALRERAAVAP